MEEIRQKINRQRLIPEDKPTLRLINLVLKLKAGGTWSSPHFWILIFITAILSFIYYAVLTSLYDIYVVLFFYPMIYAALTYRMRGVLLSGVILLAIALPRIVWLSSDVYPLIRILLIGAFAFVISGLGATLLNFLELQKAAYDEIQTLNKELKSYTERLENTQRQLIHSEKLKAIGQISASIAHEVNNPLAGILVYTKLLAKKLQKGTLDKEEALSQLQQIDEAVGFSSRIIRSLLDFSRRAEPVYKPANAGKIIEQALLLVGHLAVRKKIEVVREDYPDLPQIFADFGQIQQVLINLITNAVQATEMGGRLIIRTGLSEDKWIKIEVQDTGVGIPPENMDKLFTPFFSTREEVKGVGLGLWISYRIVENHGGKIMVESQVGKGSTFTIYLPPYQYGTAVTPESAIQKPGAKNTG